MTHESLAIDLFTGLHGWGEGLVAEGYRVIGFDIEDMCAKFGYPRPDGVQLVVQDILTLHGSQLKDARLIVASPPCQFFSYTAMPWSKSKVLAAKVRADPALLEKELALFNACFRIQREACEAAGKHIPMIVENVRGAIPWVGRSRFNYGSFHFWGDVPALMPIAFGAIKVPSFRFDGSGKSFQTASVEHTGVNAPGMNWSDRTKRGQDFTRIAGQLAGVKQGGDWFNASQPSMSRLYGSKSPQRRMASAMIAKIPLPLSRHIGAVFHPKNNPPSVK